MLNGGHRPRLYLVRPGPPKGTGFSGGNIDLERSYRKKSFDGGNLPPNYEAVEFLPWVKDSPLEPAETLEELTCRTLQVTDGKLGTGIQ